MKKIFRIHYLLLAFVCLSLVAFTDEEYSPSPKCAVAEGDTTYVIQLRKNTNPQVIQAAKKPLLAKYPDKTLLTQVQPPHYILSIGYFATEAEAEEFKKEKGLEKDYAGCTVVAVEKKK